MRVLSIILLPLISALLKHVNILGEVVEKGGMLIGSSVVEGIELELCSS